MCSKLVTNVICILLVQQPQWFASQVDANTVVALWYAELSGGIISHWIFLGSESSGDQLHILVYYCLNSLQVPRFP
jgi:hypothetical protein